VKRRLGLVHSVTHCAAAEAAPEESFAWRAALASRGRAIAAPLQKTQCGNAAAGPLQTLAQGAAFLELNARKGSGHQEAEAQWAGRNTVANL
jgi:hypothetical protein